MTTKIISDADEYVLCQMLERDRFFYTTRKEQVPNPNFRGEITEVSCPHYEEAKSKGGKFCPECGAPVFKNVTPATAHFIVEEKKILNPLFGNTTKTEINEKNRCYIKGKRFEIRLAMRDPKEENKYHIYGISPKAFLRDCQIVFIIGEYNNNFPGEWGFPQEVFVRKEDIRLK